MCMYVCMYVCMRVCKNASVAERDFFKSASHIPRQGGGSRENFSNFVYTSYSSFMTHNHKSQHGTRVQRRLRKKNHEM
jgi:hypothetical protein